MTVLNGTHCYKIVRKLPKEKCMIIQPENLKTYLRSCDFVDEFTYIHDMVECDLITGVSRILFWKY